MLNRVTLAVLSGLMAAGGSNAACGQVSSPVELVTSALVEQAITTRDRVVRVQITLKNPDDQPLSARPDTEWRNLNDGSRRPARWLAPRTGAQLVNGAFALPAKTTGAFLAEGDFESPGTYMIGLTVTGTSGSEQRFSLTVTRSVAAVPDTLFVAPKPARIDVGALRLESDSASVVNVPANNVGDVPIPLSAPRLIRFSTVTADTESPAAFASTPTVSAGTCTDELLPKQDCAIKVSLPAGLPAGRYAAGISLSGPGGGRALVDLRFDVRLSALWAGLLVAVGALVGYLVVIWRERGRTTFDHRIAAAEARSLVSRLANAARSPVRERATSLVDAVRVIENTIATGGDPGPALVDLSKRYEFLATANQLLDRAEEPGVRQMFEPLADLLKSGLQSDRWTIADTDAVASRLQSELAGLDDLTGAAKSMRGKLDDFGPIIEWLYGEARQPVTNARLLLAQAFVPIASTPVGDEQVATSRARAKALRAAAAELDKVPVLALQVAQKQIAGTLTRPPADPAPLERLHDAIAEALRNPSTIDGGRAKSLLREAKDLGQRPAPAILADSVEVAAEIPRVPTGTALTLDFNPFLFGIGQVLSPRSLRVQRWAWELFTNIVVLIGIGLSGILFLWANNPSWGSEVDFATALLAGAGTRLAIGGLAQSGR